MSGFPAGVLTRTFTVGGALSLPGGADLIHEVELRASRRLIWAATGTRIYLDPVKSTSAEGMVVSFTEAVTDQDGWLTDRGEAIILDQPNSYTHTYTVVVRVLKAGVELHKYTSVPFVLPQGVGTLRLEDLINAEAVPGLHISLPEKWDALVAQAVAAAGSATSAGVSAAAAAASAESADTDRIAAGVSAAAAAASAESADTDRIAAGVSAAEALASEQAAGLARDGAVAAQGLAEDARDGAVAAQGLAEDARDGAVTAQGLAEDARDGAVTAQGLAEDARDQAVALVGEANLDAAVADYLTANPPPAGDDGREVELQTSATHVQWRYVGDVTWLDLIPLALISGQDGDDGNDGLSAELQTTATHIQWRQAGGAWANLIPLASLVGPDGPPNALSIGTVTTLSAGSSATASVTGSAPNQTLNLGLVRGADGNPSTYELRGTGMPNGVVTASPGTYYTDTAGTNGAWRWLKTSGTGNTGWVVVFGDTGWRVITQLWSDATGGLFSGLNVRIRRNGGVVTLSVYGFKLAGAAQTLLPFGGYSLSPPAGSELQLLQLGGAGTLRGDVIGDKWRAELGSIPNGAWVRDVKTYIPHDTAWPTILPGTPA